ncbi:MAG: hypothetical protein HPM95_04275 [Alphaproteobacteria bacterium]|nr:hypothetical protein [Alphaproteobacteria bacterium]
MLERLRRAPADLQLTVNLSGQSVGDPQFRDFLVSALDAFPMSTGAFPSRSPRRRPCARWRRRAI